MRVLHQDEFSSGIAGAAGVNNLLGRGHHNPDIDVLNWEYRRGEFSVLRDIDFEKHLKMLHDNHDLRGYSPFACLWYR
jgi:hypothetical protein